jgi:hypothetical protein
MPYVIPDVSCGDIICHLECSFKASESHVVLGSVKATESHIIPKFCITHSALYKSSIKSKSYLRLISVEMVARQLCYGFNARVIILQNLFIECYCFSWIVQHIMYSRNTCNQVSLMRMRFKTLFVNRYCFLRLILPNCNFCRFQM